MDDEGEEDVDDVGVTKDLVQMWQNIKSKLYLLKFETRF